MENELLTNILNNIVMEKVVRDKIVTQQKEQRQEEARLRREGQRDQLDDFEDQETRQIMQKMKNERLRMTEEQPIKKNQEKRLIGQYREIVESEFLNYVTKLKHTVVHFYHKDFSRCKIMDKHLQLLSHQFPNTQFLYINAEKTPFFVERLAIKVLPTLCVFIDGIMKDKVLGFQGMSGDQFLTYELAARLAQSGVIEQGTTQIKDKTVLKSKKGGYSSNEED